MKRKKIPLPTSFYAIYKDKCNHFKLQNSFITLMIFYEILVKPPKNMSNAILPSILYLLSIPEIIIHQIPESS